MDPVSAVTSAWTIAKTAGEISKKLFEFEKSLKDHDAKQRLEEILDQVREMKQSASELEDENRELREKLPCRNDVSSPNRIRRESSSGI
jgi:cell shape-determining protein MreC